MILMSNVRSGKFSDSDDRKMSGRFSVESLSSGRSSFDNPSRVSIDRRGSGRGSFERLGSNNVSIEQPGSATSRRASLNMPSGESNIRRGGLDKSTSSNNCGSGPHSAPVSRSTTAACGLQATGSSSLRSSLKQRRSSDNERAVQQQHQQSSAAAAKVRASQASATRDCVAAVFGNHYVTV